MGAKLGLPTDWAKTVIKKVGNYEDIYDRNLEALFPRDRLNKQFVDEGLLLAPLFR